MTPSASQFESKDDAPLPSQHWLEMHLQAQKSMACNLADTGKGGGQQQQDNEDERNQHDALHLPS